MTARIERLTTSGAEEPGRSQELTNNVWLIGDDREVIVVDPAHEASAVLDAVAGRELRAVLLTHGHWDHIRAVAEFTRLHRDMSARDEAAQAWLHPADEFLWREEHPGLAFRPLAHGATFAVSNVALEARHTPGHTPGSTSFVAAGLGAVFTGDTLFQGGPGATRWQYSSFPQIVASIEERLMPLPDDTIVHTGHGADTTIGAERSRLPEYIARGW